MQVLCALLRLLKKFVIRNSQCFVSDSHIWQRSVITVMRPVIVVIRYSEGLDSTFLCNINIDIVRDFYQVKEGKNCSDTTEQCKN